MEIFEINAQFEDYNALIEAKKKYEVATNTLLVVDDSRKAKGTAEFVEKFKYERILYCCKAGLERPSESKGMRKCLWSSNAIQTIHWNRYTKCYQKFRKQ